MAGDQMPAPLATTSVTSSSPAEPITTTTTVTTIGLERTYNLLYRNHP
jgi:hypothetical protein